MNGKPEFDVDVEGMCCAACEERLRSDLTRLEGVARAEPARAENVVRISGDAEAYDRIEQAVRHSNYELPE